MKCRFLHKILKIVKSNIHLFLNQENDNFKVNNELVIDSIIGENDFNYLKKVNFLEIEADNITYTLNFKEETNVLGLYPSTFITIN